MRATQPNQIVYGVACYDQTSHGDWITLDGFLRRFLMNWFSSGTTEEGCVTQICVDERD